MAVKKQSFFEKLLKAKSEETDEIKRKVKAQMAEEAENQDEEEDAGDDEEEIDANISTAKVEENDPEDNWEEGEGQLTIDVYQTDSDIVIKSTIAGVKPEDIDISVNGDMITIKGIRYKDDEIQEDDYYYQECYWGSFSRSIILPVDIDPTKIDATLKNGILTVKIPRADKARVRKVKVKIA